MVLTRVIQNAINDYESRAAYLRQFAEGKNHTSSKIVEHSLGSSVVHTLDRPDIFKAQCDLKDLKIKIQALKELQERIERENL